MLDRAVNPTPDRRRSPQMPVNCGECAHAVKGSIPEFIHCVHGVRSEVRSRLLCRLCEDFVQSPEASTLDACRPQRSEDGTHQGDAQENPAVFHGNVSRNDLYVLVTRKGSLKNETNLQAGVCEA